MADNVSKHESRKHKKKHKKHSKDADGSANKGIKGSSDNNSDEQGLVSKKPIAAHGQNSGVNELAPKANDKHTWTSEERQLLFHELKEYAAQEKHKSTPYTRVDWNDISIGDINKNDLHDEYKRLIKKVRKLRTIKEVLDDVTFTDTLAEETDTEKPPKKPSNAFMLFCSSKRPSLVERHPQLTFGEVHKKLCLKWKDIGDEKKSKFVKKAEKLKKVYVQQLKLYNERQKSLVKKPQSAFEMWKIERLDEDVDGGEEELKKEWEGMPLSSKKGWIHAASNDMDRYHSELKLLGIPAHTAKKGATETSMDKSTTEQDEESESSGESDEETPDLGKRKSNLNTPIPSQVVKKPKTELSSVESSSDED